MPFSLILPAAGRSQRFGGGKDKLFEMLDGQPVIVRSLMAFLKRRDVEQIIIPTSTLTELNILLGQWLGSSLHELGKRIKLCSGGQSRAETVKLALAELDESCEWVAIHDAARPLVSSVLIDRTFLTAMEHGAAAPALPVALTIKQAIGPLPAPAKRTIPRSQLWAMQTPQIIRREDLLEAYSQTTTPLDQITDDAQLLECIHKELWLVPGDERNLKITTQTDIVVASALLRIM